MIQIRMAVIFQNSVKKELPFMKELNKILETFASSRWDLIAVPAQEWLDRNGDKEKLVTATRQAEKECGNCGCELDPLYPKALTLL